MLNRRAFLQRFASGVVAAAALAHIPASVIKAAPQLVEPARQYACERMRAVFNAYCKTHRKLPASIRLGRQMFALYESEVPIVWRFTSSQEPSHQHLLFKGVPAFVDEACDGYHCEAVA